MSDMKNRWSESGYALMTVLFIITIFSIIALSFAGQAFSNSKQNKVIEEKSQSVALAEMGIMYFQSAVRNAYHSSRDDVKEIVTNQMNADRDFFYRNETNKNKNWEPDESKYLSFAADKMTEALNKELSAIDTKVNVNDDEKVYFKVIANDTGEFAKKSENEIIITFQSNGYEHSKNSQPARLSATLTIEVNDLSFATGSEDGEGNSPPADEQNLPNFNKINKPENVQQGCKNVSVVKEGCQSILIEGTGTIGDNINKSNNITIYSTGGLIFDKNANSLNNMRIHSNAELTAQNMNGSGITNSIIESQGSATFNKQLKLNHSELLIGGAAHIKGHLDVENQSFIYIGGNATIDKHLTIDKNSKVCVAGDLSANKTFIDGQLFVKGSPFNTPQKEFEENCKVSNGNSHPSQLNPIFNWGEIIQEIEYEY